jgi:multidrug resistance efflux pump
LAQILKPIQLRATIDGFVSSISNRVGDHILPGAPVLMLGGSRNDRVVAWMLPPVASQPRIGDQVLVRRMSVGRVTTTGTVIEVGRQFEPLGPALQPPGANTGYVEVGLPILVQLDDPGDLIPGEAVQLEATFRRPAGVE